MNPKNIGKTDAEIIKANSTTPSPVSEALDAMENDEGMKKNLEAMTQPQDWKKRFDDKFTDQWYMATQSHNDDRRNITKSFISDLLLEEREQYR